MGLLITSSGIKQKKSIEKTLHNTNTRKIYPTNFNPTDEFVLSGQKLSSFLSNYW